MQQQTDGLQLDLNNVIFIPAERKLNTTYQNVVKNFYGVNIIPIEFIKQDLAANIINNYIAVATKNRIKNFAKREDVINAEIFMISTLFSKGRWKIPFNRTLTYVDTFYDSSGSIKGHVTMMHQIGEYAYTNLSSLNSHAVELPYGKGDTMSLIVILPKMRETLDTVLKLLSSVGFSYVLDSLATAKEEFEEELVQVCLPRFYIDTDLAINQVLHQMGIKDAFESDTANLLKIFPAVYSYISHIFQKSIIEVTEEGTDGVVTTGDSLRDKFPPPRFYANRDFAYFLIDKTTGSIILAGKFTNPSM